MPAITNDAEYSQAIKDLLVDFAAALEQTEQLLTREAQTNLLRSLLTQARCITESEPHLRGKVFEALTDMKQLDMERVEKDRDAYREVACELASVLRRTGAPSIKVKLERKAALAKADSLHL